MTTSHTNVLKLQSIQVPPLFVDSRTYMTPDGATDLSSEFLTAVAAAVGGTLFLAEGVYILDAATLTSAHHDVLIKGIGSDTIIKAKAGNEAAVLRLEGAYNITFQDLVFDGNYLTQTATTARTVRLGTGTYGIRFRDVVFQNNYYQALFVNGVTGIVKDVILERCKFAGTNATNGATASLVDFEAIKFIRCDFSAWDYDAIATSFFQTTLGGLTVDSCEFLNTKSDLFAIETVASGANKEFRLRKLIVINSIFDGGNRSVGGSGISSTHDDVVISGNIWRNSGAGTHRNGIEATGTDWVITDNILDNGSIVIASTTGDITTNFVVANNSISNAIAAGWGILIGGVAVTNIEDVLVTDNIIDLTGNTGSGGGVYLGTYGDPALCKRVRVKDNEITKTDAASGIGVRVLPLTGSETLEVSGNSVTGTSQGIRTDDAATDVDIFDNDLSGVATKLSLNHTTGVWRIRDNKFSKTALRGISADRGDANVTVVYNEDPEVVLYATPLTTNRTVTLSATYATQGAKFRVLRTAAATGASTLSVGGLKTLALGQWADVRYSGSAWILEAFGSL